MLDNTAIYNELRRSPAVVRIDKYSGWVHVDCPFCGKPAQSNSTHFSFNEEFGHCFVCQQTHGLATIAKRILSPSECERLGIRDFIPSIKQAERQAPRQRTERPATPADWQKRPDVYLDQFQAAPARVALWQAYKPLTPESIQRFSLGIGRLPNSRSTSPRLILPIFNGGKLVGLHGRAYLPNDPEAKWLCSRGSSKTDPLVTQPLAEGQTLVILENYVDAILGNQLRPDVNFWACGSAQFQRTWFDQIAAAKPAKVIVWFDHDLAGNSSQYPKIYQQMLDEWRAKNPNMPKTTKPPRAIGPRVVNELRRRGINAVLYRWQPTWPIKSDAGDVFTKQLKRASA